MFVYDLNLQHTSSPVETDLCLVNCTQERAIFQLAMYAVHLASGSTLHCKSIKADTAKNYVRDVASFMCRRRATDPRRVHPMDQSLAKPIAAVFDEAARWEKMPERREPFTTDMLAHLRSLRDEKPTTDTLLASLCDWFDVGLHAGLRLSEWAQDVAHSDISKGPALNKFQEPRAFCLLDVSFETATRQRLTITDALSRPWHTIARATLVFRTQKNGDDGEVRTFMQTNATNLLNPVQALLRIIKRFVEKFGYRNDIPLAIHTNDNGKASYITSKEIELHMRAAATEVYGLNPNTTAGKQSLSRWSSHSLRVGACVILHAMGFTDIQIQHLLRWRSLAFMVYLRNLGFLAQRQTQAINDASLFPQFL